MCNALFVIGRPKTPSLHASFERYVEMLETINNSPLLREEWSKHVALTRSDPVQAAARGRFNRYNLNCATGLRSSTKPSSVHKLAVGDIDIVAALGDSLTAANGASAWTILGCLTEYRGRSWSIGGDRSLDQGVSTMPNILKKFNPEVRGFSTGSGNAASSGAGYNVAVAGAIAQDMPGQAQNLVNKLRADSSINMEQDWKMITLFIGGNNLCAFCNDLNAHSAETMIANVAEALDIIRDNIPRAYVNLAEIFDISPVAGLGNGIICSLVHGAVCSCGHGADADTAALTELSIAYQRAVQALVNSGRYEGKDDFVVVNQPFYRETVPPAASNGGPDLSYFAPDCFHFSEKGQNMAGKGLWNSIVSPVGSKPADWGLDQPIQCPSRYLPTKQNS